MSRALGPVPLGAGDLTTETIAAALGRSVDVVAVERIGELYGFASETYRIDMLDGDGRFAIVAKLWAIRSGAGAAEIEFYRRIAPATPVRLAAFHHGAVDVDAGRAWLVLEALEVSRQGDDLVTESLDVVLDLAATLARIHAAWWDRTQVHGWLPDTTAVQRDADYVSSRTSEYLRRYGEISDALTRSLFEALPEALDVARDLLSEAPRTVVHQDLSLDNVVFLAPKDEPVILDWARCGNGPGVLDLASLLRGTAPLDAFHEVVGRYRQVLASAGGVEIGDDTFDRWLGGAMIGEFATRTLGVARWKADSPRGLEILERWNARLPEAVAAWAALQPWLFNRLVG